MEEIDEGAMKPVAGDNRKRRRSDRQIRGSITRRRAQGAIFLYVCRADREASLWIVFRGERETQLLYIAAFRGAK